MSDNDIQAHIIELQTDANERRAEAGPSRFHAVWAKNKQATLTSPQNRRSLTSKIKGAAHKLPLLGPLARLLATIIRLPERLGRMERGIQVLSDLSTNSLRNLEQKTESLTVQVSQLQHENFLRLQSQQKIVTQLQSIKGDLLKSESRLESFVAHASSAIAQAQPGSTPTALHASMLTDSLLDDFYWRFEERFRGSPEDITAKLKIYLPYLEAVKQSAPNRLLLDLGCGRGEWLKLVRATGLAIKGVDLNAKMVRDCLAEQLPVVFGDGVRFLQDEVGGSLAAVTGFHIVEHLPFAALMTMLKAAYRALAPGGFALFETPNPENILVGACTFYTDPTHKNPIPPPTLAFMMEEAGFVRQECVRLRPQTLDDPPVHAATLGVVQRFYEAPDYAIIGFKDKLEL
jgi:O-antigen chain-terminating methyltransferase